MIDVHNDIDILVGGKCATNYLIDEGGSTEHNIISDNTLCYCSWHLQDDLNYKAEMSSYFNSGRSMSNNFEFERNNYSNKTNYDASYKNEKKDTITVNGLKINATYHSSSNPYVSGTITNNSNKTVEYIKVKVALKDSNGKVVNTVWTYAVGAEGLAPNESSEWKVYCTEATSISISLFE